MTYVPGFRPSGQGFRFDNHFPKIPGVIIHIGPITIPLGDASNGLCGGMCFAARDYFEARRPIPTTTTAPTTGAPLYDHIVQRLVDSWNLPLGPTKYTWAMNPGTSDADLNKSMAVDEWPAIAREIDSGKLSQLGLVQVRSSDWGRIGDNHQVLAYGYDDAGDEVTIHVYDPNRHGDDNVTITFRKSNPHGTVRQSTGREIFAFFRVNYGFAPPPQGEHPEWVAGWRGWTSVGGTLTADPVLAAQADGRLVLFTRDMDGHLRYSTQMIVDGPWGQWEAVNGALAADPGFVVGHNRDGRLELFARAAGGDLVHLWQTAPNGGLSAWTRLGGVFAGRPAVGNNADGRLELVARHPSGGLLHCWQQPAGGWSGWNPFPQAVFAGSPAIARNADGRLEVFGIDDRGATRHAWQTAPNSGWTTAWDDLGGTATGDVAAVANKDGHLELLATGVNRELGRRWQQWPSWNPWWEATGAPPNQPITSSPTAVTDPDGKVSALVLAQDNHVHERRQTAPGSADWSDWYDLAPLACAGRPSAAVSAGKLVIAVRGADRATWVNCR